MAENFEKNAIDKDEYPMTADLENRCVDIIGKLWNVDKRKSHSELPRLAPLKRACSAD